MKIVRIAAYEVASAVRSRDENMTLKEIEEGKRD